MSANIPQATIDKITDEITATIMDQITAKIMLTLKDSVSQVVSQAVTSALANIPQPSLKAPPAVNPDPDPFPVSLVPKPDLGNAQWIWTQEQPFAQLSGGPRAFRRAVQMGQYVDSMMIDITYDNHYTLYVNGYLVGNGKNWRVAQRFSIKFPRTNRIFIAVYAANDPISLKQAGVIASAVTWDSTSSSRNVGKINTDSSWESSITACHSGFERTHYRPDSSWTAARVEGPYGMPPWGTVPKPTATNALNGAFSGIHGVVDPPSAPLATPGPYTVDDTIGPNPLALLDGAD